MARRLSAGPPLAREGAATPARKAAPGKEPRVWNGFTFMLAPPALFIAVLFIYPLLGMAARSLTEGAFPGAIYLDLARDNLFLLSLRNTFTYALLTAGLAAVLGYPVAVLIGFSRPAVANVLLLLVMVPFWTSILVRSYAWLVVLGREGILNFLWMGSGLGTKPLQLIFNSTGVVVAMVHVMLPYMILPLLSTISRINKDVLAAASGLGASPCQAFRRVLLPLTLPGAAGGFALVFVLSLGLFITPVLMGGPREVVTAMVIYDQITRQLDWDHASAVSVILLLLTGGAFFVCARIFGLQRHMSLG
jgi:putative spermidine/putrescine transport system permease protein